MNTILAKATTWTLASLVSATIATQAVDKGVTQFNYVKEQLADATGHKKLAQKADRFTLETLFEDTGWTKEGGIGGGAFELAERLAQLVTAPACSNTRATCGEAQARAN